MEKPLLICDPCGEGRATLAIDHVTVTSARGQAFSVDLCAEHAATLYALCGVTRPKRRYTPHTKKEKPNGESHNEAGE